MVCKGKKKSLIAGITIYCIRTTGQTKIFNFNGI